MIVWREEMSIGVVAIDDDHKALIDIINEFEDSKTRLKAEVSAKKLFTYTQSHFRREEELQDAFRYPHRHDQKHDHGLIIKDLRGIIKSAFVDKTLSDDGLIASLSKLMHDWIIGHVLTHDMKMKHFFQITDPSEYNFLPPSILKQSLQQSVGN